MSCPFCSVDESRIAFSNDSVIAFWDGSPVSEGHLLVISRRHASTWPNLNSVEKAAMVEAIDQGQAIISERFHPDGFNVGFNENSAAGQSVFHFHLHIIPRYEGDVADPRGGVRHVIPEKANYLLGREVISAAIERRLVTGGGTDPLLPHLLLHLDGSTICDIAVAFLLDSGARMIVAHLRDFLARGGQARILVGDYLDVTEPAAIRRLNDLSGDLVVRAFEAYERGFHLKTYIFQTELEGIAFVGSSNLSAPALTTSIEWNYKVISSHERAGFSEITAGFESIFNSYQAVSANEAWIRGYEARRTLPDWRVAGVAEEPSVPMAVPHSIQQQALAALEETRREGYSAGLIVLATGLGKTWLSAFDSDRPEFRRILFVAHREEILNQAIDNFRRVRPNASIGRMIGSQRDSSDDLIFASVQTLGRIEHLDRFAPTAFDYIIIDEFHHAAAVTYRRIIDYFEPKFLLGLTATPERMDGGDLLSLCQENLVFEASVPDGVTAGLLCNFQYLGVPDVVDYTNIPWRNARFDPTELTAAVATEARAQNALEQFRKHGAQRCIAFCCSQRHANFMAEFFNARGLRSVAVHAGSESAPRATSLQQLAKGELDVIFSVDMFNEGVDVPNIDTVLMLRPTESTVVWMQQFGRGLRKAPDKPYLKVIDYIGNHRSFLMKLRSIAALADINANSAGALRSVLDNILKKELHLPEGCSVTYELESIRILESLLKPARPEAALEAFYRDFLERHGVRPTAVEAFHEGFNPRANSERSWLGFVLRMKGLSEAEATALSISRAFLESIEKTEVSRSYSIILLLAMIAVESIPGEIAIDKLVEQVAKLANRYLRIRDDLSADIGDEKTLRRLLVESPIRAFVDGRATGDVSFFRFEGGNLSSTFDTGDAATFRDLLREILDWRLAQYLSRKSLGDEANADIVCRVARTGEHPVLLLPSAATTLHLEQGPTPVRIDEETYEASIAKIAIHIIRRPGAEMNLLPEILHRWFGEEAGLPGRGERVRLKRDVSGFALEPLRIPTAQGLHLWERYSRNAIAPAFGLTFSQAIWNAGFVVQDPEVFLLVTLAKDDMNAEHRYVDHFVSDHEFAWQSQNRTTRASKHGQLLSNHHTQGKRIHLFVRSTKKTGSKPTPFVYCGEVDFVSWEGDAPISIRWKLREAVPAMLRGVLGVPA
jgi:superfamily II DNA or RNA helicase/diadenosine tetraphosphate (Ap4A) HIT family hydrolase/HKD family nuclease